MELQDASCKARREPTATWINNVVDFGTDQGRYPAKIDATSQEMDRNRNDTSSPQSCGIAARPPKLPPFNCSHLRGLNCARSTKREVRSTEAARARPIGSTFGSAFCWLALAHALQVSLQLHRRRQHAARCTSISTLTSDRPAGVARGWQHRVVTERPCLSQHRQLHLPWNSNSLHILHHTLQAINKTERSRKKKEKAG